MAKNKYGFDKNIDPENRAVYDRQFGIFKRLYKQNRKLNKELNFFVICGFLRGRRGGGAASFDAVPVRPHSRNKNGENY